MSAVLVAGARVRALVAIALAALVLAACGEAGPGGGDPNVAATVNGESIPVSEVEERFASVEDNEQLAAQLEADEDGAFQEQVQAQILTQLIQSEILRQGAESDLDIQVDDADVAETREQIIEEVGGEEQFEQIIEQSGLSEEQVEQQLRDIAVQEAVQAELSGQVDVDDADVEAFYEEQRDTRFGETAEARHILTESEDEAQEALERVEGGEDFGEVAEDLSTDPGSAEQGGDLGEFTRGQMVPEFSDAVFEAEEGDLVGPVESEFGFHVIEVISVSEGPELAEVEEEIREELAQAQQGEAVQSWIADRNAEAEVEVNPRFGTWDAAAGQVVPEGGLEGPAPGEGAPVEPGAGDPQPVDPADPAPVEEQGGDDPQDPAPDAEEVPLGDDEADS